VSFHDVRFAPKISLGATGGPLFSTVVVDPESGYEPNRVIRWDAPRLKWDAGSQTYKPGALASLLAFFRARQGKRMHPALRTGPTTTST
jgi:uncharacterized protein (TIGR02217 family)